MEAESERFTYWDSPDPSATRSLGILDTILVRFRAGSTKPILRLGAPTPGLKGLGTLRGLLGVECSTGSIVLKYNTQCAISIISTGGILQINLKITFTVLACEFNNSITY